MKKIITNIIHRFKEDSLLKRVNRTGRKVEYKDKKEIKKCLVFWTMAPEQELWLEKTVVCFPGVKIDKLCFIPTGAGEVKTEGMVSMRKEDLGFGGKIQNPHLHHLLTQKYDLLLDLNLTSNALINYVLTNSQASCIMAMKKENGIADVVINGVSEPLQFIERASEMLAETNTY